MVQNIRLYYLPHVSRADNTQRGNTMTDKTLKRILWTIVLILFACLLYSWLVLGSLSLVLIKVPIIVAVIAIIEIFEG